MPSDKRRPDLALPYAHQPDGESDFNLSGALKVMPIGAMFLKSKILSWSALFLAVQSYLSQPENLKEGDSAISSIMTALVAVVVSYMDFIYVPGAAKVSPAAPAAAATQ